MFTAKILVWVLSGLYFVTAIVLALIGKRNVGPQNDLKFVTLGYLGYLCVNIVSVGALLLRRIRELSGNIYK